MPTGRGDIINPDTIGGGQNVNQGGTEPFTIKEFTRAKDSYNGNQSVYAGYALLDLPMVRWFRIVGGARFEANDIRVSPYDIYGRTIEETDRATLKNRNVLPSASLIFSPTSKMNIRLVGAETVARPEFRELAPFLFTDFVGGFNVFGNPKLQQTKIWNADVRWEWFPSANEVIAVSGFVKYFDAPIERVIYSSTAPLQTYLNTKSATNLGVEVEVRKSLEFIAKPLRDLSLGANFAYIYSRVRLAEGVMFDVATSRERPLEGQSPFVINAFLAYDNEKTGTNTRLLYNTFGKRIAFVGGMGMPDVYERPVHTLDFALLQRLHKGLNLNINVFNMMNWRQRMTQGGDQNIFYATRRGVTFVVGFNYTF
jgi:hypothetical protein